MIESDALVPSPKPIGIYGWCDDNSKIYDADGKRVPE